jgi:uncharacterized protein YciI
MLYMITGTDRPDGLARRKLARPEHLARAQELVKAGRLLLGGPCPTIDSPDPGPAGYSGSLIVAEFDSLEAARAWIAADPYVTTGVFESWDVRPFVKVLP